MGGKLEILSTLATGRKGTTLRATFPATFPYVAAIDQNGSRRALKKTCQAAG
jgi:hypothetical protein